MKTIKGIEIKNSNFEKFKKVAETSSILMGHCCRTM